MENLKKNKKLNELVEKARAAIDSLRTTEISKFEEHSIEKKGDEFAYSISFEGGSEHIKHNFIMNAVGTIGRIKDHIIEIEQNKDIETYINESKELCLVLDLWNIDKHGYPLRYPRTKYYPILKNIKTGLTGYREGGIIKYGDDEDNLATVKNMAIKIYFDVADRDSDKILIEGENLLNKSLEQIQSYINNK